MSNSTEPQGDEDTNSPNILIRIIREAIQQVDEVKYALAIAGIAAVAALIGIFFKQDYFSAFIVIGILFIFMVILVIFQALPKLVGDTIKIPAMILAWFVLIFFIAINSVLFFSVFFEKPKPIDKLLEPLIVILQKQKPISTPKVLIMDSHLPDVVYKLETRKKGGSNADDIREILDDIDPPIQLPRESTNLSWHGEQQVLEHNPDIIIIHASAFYQRTDVEDSEKKFLSFLEFIGKRIQSKFLIYSRSRSFCQNSEDYSREYYENKIPVLEKRIEIFPVCASDTWDNNMLQRNLRTKVESILKLNEKK
ncbi:MAG: hypothetical protein QNJ47_07305 [Nostocaceae cyanobacterium]|nr:hypothetical protein [Nostocaceae cyanobacterium]